MKWKVIAQGDKPSRETILILVEQTGLLYDEILLSLSNGSPVICNNLTENRAQDLSDLLSKDIHLNCRILPEKDNGSNPVPTFRVLLIDFRPGYRTRLRRRLQKLTKLSHEKIVFWLSRMPFVLSIGVDGDTARQIRKAVTEAGGIVRIEPEFSVNEKTSFQSVSTAVFKAPIESSGRIRVTKVLSSESDSDISSRREATEQRKRSIQGNKSSAPPYTDLPDGFMIGPPPLGEVDTTYGRVTRNPPLRFMPGKPLPSAKSGILQTPPVIPNSSKCDPPVIIEFSPPLSIFNVIPEIIGSKEKASVSRGPIPEVIIPFPPRCTVDSRFLLPPVISGIDRKDVTISEIGIPPVIVNMKDDPYSIHMLFRINEQSSNSDSNNSSSSFHKRPTENPRGIINTPLKLFVCSPSSDREEEIAEVLSNVFGYSVNKCRKLLKQPTSWLASYNNYENAREIARRLEERGVTVSIMRDPVTTRHKSSGNSRNDFQAWLTANG